MGMNHDLRYKRVNTGPRGSGRTTRILKTVIKQAIKGDQVIFMVAGALGPSWDLCVKIKQPKREVKSMRKLEYGEKGGYIMFSNHLRRELLIGTDRRIILDHTFEWS